MASITNAAHTLVTNSRLSSLYLSTNKVLPSCLLLKTRSSASSRASSLAFSPLPDKNKAWVPVGFSGKPLTLAGWNQTLRRRGQVEFPVAAAAAAADADDREIEISDGLGT